MSPAHLIIGLTLATAIAATFWLCEDVEELRAEDGGDWPHLNEEMKVAARNQAGSGLTRRPSDTQQNASSRTGTAPQ